MGVDIHWRYNDAAELEAIATPNTDGKLRCCRYDPTCRENRDLVFGNYRDMFQHLGYHEDVCHVVPFTVYDAIWRAR